MSISDPKLLFRVAGWQAVLTVSTALLAALIAPRLLLLRPEETDAAALALVASISAGGFLAGLRTYWVLNRHRFVLRALTLGSRTVEPFELQSLSAEIWRVTTTWLIPPLVALAAFALFLRPAPMSQTTAFSVALLAALLVAAAALPFHVLVRAGLLRVIELADPAVMREVVEDAERRGVASSRVVLRLLAAVATPVAFVAIGSALIASAHLRRSDQLQREETARALARAALELGPGVVANAGIDEAIAQARELGFFAAFEETQSAYGVTRDEQGITELVTPLDQGQVRVRFSDSTAPVLGLDGISISLLAILVSAALGISLGRALSRDLRSATLGVRAIIQNQSDTRLLRRARFRVVAELGAAVDRLALRFQVFARAQRRAIDSRESVARMRGLFFASVSHDLKSPLNAILGFTELVRQSESLTREQQESLDQIERSGHELLALIETILDAARVEARQLTLVKEPVSVEDLLTHAADVGRRLGGKPDARVIVRVPPALPQVQADRLRLARALATFIAHGIRTSLGVPIAVDACEIVPGSLELRVHLASDRSSAHQLDGILDPTRRPAPTEPRGLALGLGLARTMIELHGGSVKLLALSETTTSVIAELPAIARRA